VANPGDVANLGDVARASASRLFVGTIDEVIVGLAAGTVRTRATPARVECCYVEPGAREIGLGSELLTALLEWFAASGCSDIDALSLPGDRETKQLLETAGFKTRLLVLHRPIDPHRPIGPRSARG
jgi:GNAT superfamily N-acetyltransferase